MPIQVRKAAASKMEFSIQSITEIFIEFMDQMYYPGYTAELDPGRYQFEFNLFSSNYSLQ